MISGDSDIWLKDPCDECQALNCEYCFRYNRNRPYWKKYLDYRIQP